MVAPETEIHTLLKARALPAAHFNVGNDVVGHPLLRFSAANVSVHQRRQRFSSVDFARRHLAERSLAEIGDARGRPHMGLKC